IDLRTVSDATGVDPEERHVAYVWLGYRLEHLGHKWSTIDPTNLNRLGIAPRLSLGRWPFGGGGHQLDQVGQQLPGNVGQVSGPTQQRVELALGSAFFQSGDQLLALDLITAQVPLEQRIVSGRYSLD